VFAGLIHAVFVFSVVGFAFAIGCWLDFLKHPWEWISDYWLPALMIIVGIVGGIRQGWHPRGTGPRVSSFGRHNSGW